MVTGKQDYKTYPNFMQTKSTEVKILACLNYPPRPHIFEYPVPNGGGSLGVMEPLGGG